MVEDTVVLEHCYICSQPLRNGDSAAGITRGNINETYMNRVNLRPRP